MSQPFEHLYLEHLQQASNAIVAPGSQTAFESMRVMSPITEQREYAGYVACMTNVYMIPGEPVPKLHKAHLRGSSVPPAIAQDLTTRVATHMNRSFVGYNNDAMRHKVQAITAAYEALDKPQPLIVPFEILALLAIYDTSEGAVAEAFASRPFVDALDELEVDELPAVEEFPEKVYRDVYSLQSEQGDVDGTYEEWRDSIREGLAHLDPNASRRRLPIVTASLLLLPKEATHPTINAALF